MPKISAGLLMYRGRNEHRASPEVLLAHPGGPFWKNKDDGAWMIPKGEVEEGEQLLAAAIREFNEETGLTAVEPFLAVGREHARHQPFLAIDACAVSDEAFVLGQQIVNVKRVGPVKLHIGGSGILATHPVLTQQTGEL